MSTRAGRFGRVGAASCVALAICTSAFAQSADGFNPGASGSVYSLAVQADGRILVGGAFTMLGGGGSGTTSHNHLARLAQDGSLDASFNPGANGDINAIAVQADGRILVAGNFTTLGGGGTGTTARNSLGRLNTDGSLDTNFNPGANGAVYGVALQSDGKILVTGGFSMLGGGGTGTTARRYLGRLNTDGSLDASFDPGLDSFAYALAVQPDGKILVGGWFTMLGGGGTGTTSRNRIGRLNADGSLDASFNPGANDLVNTLAVQSDGRIVVGGNFTLLGGGGSGSTTRNRIARLNADGSLDSTFNPGANDAVRALTLQLDGKVVAVGSFTGLGGGTGSTARRNVGRLNIDGTLDSTFDPGANGYWVFGLAIQDDGRILVGGDFLALGGGGAGTTSRARIGRLTTNTAASVQSIDISNSASTITWSRSGAGPEVSRVSFEASSDASTYMSLGSGTRVTGGWQLSGLNLPPNQNLYIRARGYYGTNGWFSGSGSVLESIRRVYTSCSTIALSATAFANGTAGQAYPPTTITQSGGVGVTTFAVTSGALPGGMSLSSAGVLSGTPTTAGPFTVTITATDENGCIGSRTYTITIAPACASIAPSAFTFAAAGGTGSVTITAPAGCAWSVTSVPSWASTVSGAGGNGSGTWQYTVAANPGPVRSQTISAAGHAFELRQLAGGAVPFGVWDDLAWEQGTSVDTLIDQMVTAGVRNVRMAFRWYMIEPSQDAFSFGVHDAIVAKLRAHGIEILGLLEHPPNWAISGPAGITPPTNDADWQDYISQVATHFRGQVANWEIWNEESLHYTWYPQPDAVRYTQLLRIAFNAIRSADPDATVVLGGLGNNGTFMGWEDPQDRYYLQKLYDAGARDYFDVLNVHIYVHPNTEGVNGLRTYLQDTHAVKAANGDAAKPVWLTETGWSLLPNGSTPNITETDQANLLTSVFNGRSSLGVERIYWFSFHDLPADGDYYGLVRSNLSLRPSYTAFRNFMIAPPSITTQPQSQTIGTGHGATMSVSASGAEPMAYQWFLGASGTTSAPISGATSSSYTTPALASTTSYWVRVSNTNPPAANSVTATVTVDTHQPFTDDLLVAGVAVIRAIHIAELRTRIDALRVRFALTPFAWTDPTLTPGATSIKAQHILELRSALSAVYTKIGSPSPIFTDPSPIGVTLKVSHIAELRAAVIALE